MNVYQSILITGGKGMLAFALRRILEKRGLRYVAVDLPECDLTRKEDVEVMFRTHRPTLLINCAAHTKVDLCEEQEDLANAINGHAVGMLAEYCANSGTRLVHVSTDFVFDGKGTRPYRPEDPTNPLSAYGRSKLLGERSIQGIAPPGWIIARTAWLYGPNGASFPRSIIERARAGQPLKVVNDQIGSPTYTCDLAEALLNLVDCSASGIFHVTNSGQTSWFDFARAILEELGLSVELSGCTTEEYLKIRPKQARRPAYSVLDLGGYTRVTGKSMRMWREALQDYRVAVTGPPQR